MKFSICSSEGAKAGGPNPIILSPLYIREIKQLQNPPEPNNKILEKEPSRRTHRL